jgi:multidrug resistance efflux pump
MAERLLQLHECTEFGLTLRARPPAVVHGAAFLLTVLVGSAITWASLTRASLVVKGVGRVRPVNVPTKVYSFGNSEVLSASTGGRVIEVNYRQGKLVHKGDVLIRLDTEKLKADIVKREQTIKAAEEELKKLEQMDDVLADQHDTTRSQSEAELRQAEMEIREEREKRASERRSAEIALELAEETERRARRLAARSAGSLEDLEKAVSRVHEEKERLAKASLEVPQGRLDVLRRKIELVDREFSTKKKELDIKRTNRTAERDSERIELANLQAQLKNGELRATVEGIVTSEEVKVGDRIEPNRPIVEIAEQAGFCFELEIGSEDVGLLSVGLPVKIKLDAYDFQRYGTLDGEIIFISPDSGVPQGRGQETGPVAAAGPSATANRPPTYLVRVRMSADVIGRGEFTGQVKLGMTGQAEVVTGEETILTIFTKRIRQAFSLT